MKKLIGVMLLSLFTSLTFAGPEIQIESEHIQQTVDNFYYNFGPTQINTVRTVSYVLTNTGSAPLNFQDSNISGAYYSASHNCATALVPRQQCRFVIRYLPQFEGNHSGRFDLKFFGTQQLNVVVDLWGQGLR